MAKELLVNVSRGEEVRVAVVENGRLEEIYLERDNAASNVGNIYLGKVTNVEGSIQAAFVDFGYGRNGFLHVQDLHPDYFPDGGRWDKMEERVGKKIGRRDRPPIQDCLRRGDRIVVQIIKEGIGTKGPTLTSYPSIPGRYLVMMPGVGQLGVSKNIEDEVERRRLRKILDGMSPPKDVGFIIRSAGLGKTKSELERDFKYLTRLYEQIEAARKSARAPTLLHSEGDLVTRTVRDVWSSDIDRIVVDDVETALQIRQFFKLLMPRTKVDVRLYRGEVPLFHAAGVEHEIETMFSRHVPLPSGGSLVIDATEAVIAIDVNSGKFREHSDAEETAFRTDLEAAEEICRQLRLRDLGGLVICDFIDLRYARHRQALFDKLTDLFKRDRAKSRHLEMNEFGIVCITRQRMRPDLKKSVFMPCPLSNGTGYIKTPESMDLDILRKLRVACGDDRVKIIHLSLYPRVANHVLNHKRKALADLEIRSGKIVHVHEAADLPADAIELELLDERDGRVVVEALKAVEEEKPDQGGRRKRRRRRPSGSDAASDRRDGQTDEESGESDTLIELDGLLPLRDLALQEVESLVGKLLAEEAADRETRDRDPAAAIIAALESHADDPDDDDRYDAPPARRDTQPRPVAEGDRPDVADDDDEEEEKTGEDAGRGRRRRRRRRRGGRDDAQDVTPVADESGDESDDQLDEDAGDEPPAEPQPEPTRRRVPKGRRLRSRTVFGAAPSTRDEDGRVAPQPAASLPTPPASLPTPPASLPTPPTTGKPSRNASPKRTDGATPTVPPPAKRPPPSAKRPPPPAKRPSTPALYSERDDEDELPAAPAQEKPAAVAVKPAAETVKPAAETVKPAADAEPARPRRRNRAKIVRSRPIVTYGVEVPKPAPPPATPAPAAPVVTAGDEADTDFDTPTTPDDPPAAPRRRRGRRKPAASAT